MELIFNVATTEKRAAVKEEGQVTEIQIERPLEDRLVDNIYIGKVKDVLPGMQAAFVDIGREKNGFLHRDDVLDYQRLDEPIQQKKKRSISHFLTEGQRVIVQVKKEEFGNKGVKLSGMITLPGKYVVYVPEGDYIGISKRIQPEEKREALRKRGQSFLRDQEGLIIRTLFEQVSDEEVETDLEYGREEWMVIQEKANSEKPPSLLYQGGEMIERFLRDMPLQQVSRIVVDDFTAKQKIKRLLRREPKMIENIEWYQGKENVFSVEGVEKELERALKKTVPLPSGAFLYIEQTEALTVIDVNTGSFTGRDNVAKTMKDVNVEAAKEIAKQLRLRDIGGIIIIDFIGMKAEKDEHTVVQALKKACKKDRTLTNILGMTQLGLVEMTRKRVRQSLKDVLLDRCHHCKGTGVNVSTEEKAYQVERLIYEHRTMDEEAILIEVSPDVISLMEGEWLESLKKKYGFYIALFATHTENTAPQLRMIGTKEEVISRQQKK